MNTISITPESFKQFGPTTDATFCLVTNSEFSSIFEIDTKEYNATKILPYSPDKDFKELLKKEIPERAHILVVLPNSYFKSPQPEDLGPSRKLCVMACNSTPTTVEAIQHFLDCAKRTDPHAMDEFASLFFEELEKQTTLTFYDSKYNTSATFNHLSENIMWHEQAGKLDWGQQQLFPSGEISALTVQVYNMSEGAQFELNGEITLQGYPILHSGKGSFLTSDQERIYQRLSTLITSPLIATVKQGKIIELNNPSSDDNPALSMLESLFLTDSRYQSIIEIGFGINHWNHIYPGNSAMNEVYAASPTGTIHWGLGLTPSTQYHLDIISPNTSILGDDKKFIFGKGL